jgi:hypothetical protein
MKFKNLILGAVFTASSLFAALNDVGTINSSTHTIGSTTPSKTTTINFNWTKPTGATEYCYILDTNSSATSNYVLNATYSNCGDNPKHVSINSGDTTSKNVEVNASGDYYFHIVALNDTESSSSKTTTGAVKIDIDKGTVTATAGGSFSTSKAVTLTANENGRLFYTVDGSDVNTSDTTNSGSTKSVLDNSNPPTASFTLAVTASVKTKLVDTAGNIGDEASTTYTITNNPTIKTNAGAAVNGQTIATNTNGGASTTVPSLDINGTDFTRYEYKIDSAATYTLVGDLDTNIDITGLSSGSHTVNVRAGDAYNMQTADTSVTFTVDNTAPTNVKIAIGGVDVNESNQSHVTKGDNFSFTLSASDGTIKYSTDGTTTPSASAGSTYSSVVTTNKTVNTGSTSTFPIKFTAYDAAGNIATVQSVNFTIDKQKPTLTMPTTATFSTTKDVSISSDDNDSTIYYLVSNSSTTPSASSVKTNGVSGSGSGVTATIGKNPTNQQQDGTYKYLYAIAVDIAGNGDENADVQSVTFTYSGNSKILSASPSSLDLGSVATNSSGTAVVTITNDGTESIEVRDSNMSFVGSDFNLSSTTCDGNISSSSTCTVTVAFNPTSRGAKTGTLRIAYDGTDTNELNVSLSGTAINAAPSVTFTSNVVTSVLLVSSTVIVILAIPFASCTVVRLNSK